MALVLLRVVLHALLIPHCSQWLDAYDRPQINAHNISSDCKVVLSTSLQVAGWARPTALVVWVKLCGASWWCKTPGDLTALYAGIGLLSLSLLA